MSDESVMSSEQECGDRPANGGCRKGELDLADMIESFLWDHCDGEDQRALEYISENAWNNWLANVRRLLDHHHLNAYFDENFEIRK